LAGFRGRERTLGENLGEVFVSIFHHHVEAIPVRKAVAADVEDAEQIGMGELPGAAPKRELEIGARARGNEFDGGSLRLRVGELREEDGRVFRTP
jgi:hypothetical protein